MAEVLITLTIIGVVASITVLTLSRNATNHTTITTLKSTYSILSQAIHRAQADYGDASEWTTERWTEQGAIDIAEKLKPYLKIAKDCGTYDEKMECMNYEHVVQKNGIISRIDLPKDRRYYKFVLNNGVLVRLKVTDTSEHANGIAFVFL